LGCEGSSPPRAGPWRLAGRPPAPPTCCREALPESGHAAWAAPCCPPSAAAAASSAPSRPMALALTLHGVGGMYVRRVQVQRAGAGGPGLVPGLGALQGSRAYRVPVWEAQP
jgi:hypothetical protein